MEPKDAEIEVVNHIPTDSTSMLFMSISSLCVLDLGANVIGCPKLVANIKITSPLDGHAIGATLNTPI